MERPQKVMQRSISSKPSDYAVRSLFILLACILIFAALVPIASALSVNPARQQLANPKDQSFTFVYSVVNNDPLPRTITIRLDPNSLYFKDRVTFSKEQFNLRPGDAENIQLVINPAGLGPETHTLTAGLYDGNQRLAQLELLVIVPGVPVEQYALKVKAQDTTTGSQVPITITLGNSGNVIGYARMRVDILSKDTTIGSVVYPEVIQVLPQTQNDYELPFNEQLEPGFYTAHVSAVFASTNATADSQFSVELGTTSQTIKTGDDLVLTFASLHNPSQVTYTLTDRAGKERAAGTFTPDTGDMTIPMHDLPPGEYNLVLSMRGSERHIAITVQDPGATMRLILVGAIGIIIIVALVSLRGALLLRVRVWRLTWMIAKRRRQVTNLINRSHELVDEYATHARRQHAARETRAPGQGS